MKEINLKAYSHISENLIISHDRLWNSFKHHGQLNTHKSILIEFNTYGRPYVRHGSLWKHCGQLKLSVHLRALLESSMRQVRLSVPV